MNKFNPLGIGAGTLIAKRYEIEKKIGSGAVSAVFKARDKQLDNSVCALKILDPKTVRNEIEIERFRHEILITRKLSHPNIVRTYEFGQTDEGLLFITMEYIEGNSLEQLITRSHLQSFSVSEIVFILHSVAECLSYAHKQGIIHRDLKSANILVSSDNTVKVTDFGLAKQLQSDIKLTQDGHCVGTPAYMSPEQIQGDSIDHRSDIFSFGIVSYELITGQLPFTSTDWYNIGREIIAAPLPNVSSQQYKVPQWMIELVYRCCEKNLTKRIQSADEILETLEEHNAQADEKHSVKRVVGRQRNSEYTTLFDAVPNSLYRAAPALIFASIVLFLLVGALSASSEKVKSANTNLKQSQKHLEGMLQNMEKAITVIQKFDENNEAIDKLYKEIEKEKQAKTLVTQKEPLSTELTEKTSPQEDTLLNDNKNAAATTKQTNQTGQSPTSE